MRSLAGGLRSIALGWIGLTLCFWGYFIASIYIIFGLANESWLSLILSLASFLMGGISAGLITGGSILAVRPLSLQGRSAIYAALSAHALSAATVAIVWLLVQREGVGNFGELLGLWSAVMSLSMAILILFALKGIASTRPNVLVAGAALCFAAMVAVIGGALAISLPVLVTIAWLFWTLAPLIASVAAETRQDR